MKKILLGVLLLTLIICCCVFVGCDAEETSVNVLVQFPTNSGLQIKDEIERNQSSIYNNGVLVRRVSYNNNTIFFFADNHSTLDIDILGYEPISIKVNGDNFTIPLVPKKNEVTINAFNGETRIYNFNVETTKLDGKSTDPTYILSNGQSSVNIETGFYKVVATSPLYTFNEERVYINEACDINLYGFANTYPLTVKAVDENNNIINDVTFYSNELANVKQDEIMLVSKNTCGKITAISDTYNFTENELEFNLANNEIVFRGVKKKIDIRAIVLDNDNNVLNPTRLISSNANFIKQDDGSFLASVDIDEGGSVKCLMENVVFENEELSFDCEHTILEFRATSFLYKFYLSSELDVAEENLSFYTTSGQVFPNVQNDAYSVYLDTPFDSIHIESDNLYPLSDVYFATTYSIINLQIKSYNLKINSLYEYKDSLTILDGEQTLPLDFDNNGILNFEKLVTQSGELVIKVKGFKTITLPYSKDNNTFDIVLEKEILNLSINFLNEETIDINDLEENADYSVIKIANNHFNFVITNTNLKEITIIVLGYKPYTQTIDTDTIDILVLLEKLDETEDDKEVTDKATFYSISGTIFFTTQLTTTQIEECINNFAKLNKENFDEGVELKYNIVVEDTPTYLITGNIVRYVNAVTFSISKVKENTILAMPTNCKTSTAKIGSLTTGETFDTAINFVVSEDLNNIYFLVSSIN